MRLAIFRTTDITAFGKIDLENISKYDENSIYGMLQEWIIWNNNRGIISSSIRCYFNNIRSYFWYRGLKLDQRDIRQNLKFPRILRKDMIPTTREKIQKIFAVSNSEFKLQLLALISSGMRVGELGCIKNIHIDMKFDNAVIRIPTEITKTGRARVTFLSRQVTDMLREKIDNDDYFACKDRSKEQFTNLLLKRFSSARTKAGLMQMHNHCMQHRYHVHIHGLRSYFITNVNSVQFGVGHILAGHDFYMKEYNQYAVDELRATYAQAEKYLTF